MVTRVVWCVGEHRSGTAPARRGETEISRRPPVLALLLESAVSCGLVLLVGTESGRNSVDQLLTTCGLSPAPWEQYFGGFDTLVAASAPLFWGFLVLTGSAVFVLRRRDPDRERPFRIPLYPFTPVIFCTASLYMLYASLAYAGNLAWIGLLPIAAALWISWLHRGTDSENS